MLLPAIVNIYLIPIYISLTECASFGREYILCDFSNVVGSGHSELGHPMTTKVVFYENKIRVLVSITQVSASGDRNF